jgi:uncharacterized DUF497 family protein
VHIVFDPEKDATNLSKHGVSMSAAAQLDWDAALATGMQHWHGSMIEPITES